ncbi:alpha-D-ribose 1-methylphosphonate 5-triphosphate synthase subunit PhnI [Rhizobiales bacterium GAS188]|nr:alpha-D-ribose 1-methylphosphonate 5-triphosphate synthase subunit PhnI [Rhizobiales bacterium GAS188]
MYVAVKGGEKAIEAAHELLAQARRGDPAIAEIELTQISEQLALAVARVMSEASLYDTELAALAIKQARGDLIEAIFLARAYRTTLPRFGESLPLETARMTIERRISACFKDMPGGQVLGPTFDYTHRLLGEMGKAEELSKKPGDKAVATSAAAPAEPPQPASYPRVADLLGAQALIEPDPPPSSAPPGDITREPLEFPAGRDLRLQALARGDEGFLLGLAYSTQRGFGRTHPFAGEIRFGTVEVEFDAPELGFAVPLGRVEVTECDMVNQFRGTADTPPQFTRGYGLVFGQSERKAMSMALVDRALRAREFGEEATAPAQDEEFVLSHADNVQATGFVEHLKLPHYVDFQAELVLLRQLRREWEERHAESDKKDSNEASVSAQRKAAE